MRTRLVVVLALALVGVALSFTLSQSRARDAGSDHIVPAGFSATLPTGGLLCQINPYLPAGAASAQIVVGTFGHRMPQLALLFTAADGAEVATGVVPPGGREGTVTIPISIARDPGTATKVCLTVAGRVKTVIAGQSIPPDPTDETVNGVPQPGRISVVYLHAKSQSWSRGVRVIAHRFGLGKASFFGDWSLPAMAVLLASAWSLTLRLLLRDDAQ